MVLVISALLPAALAVAVALWRQGQVPFILLLDVFDLQFVTQELTASLAVIVVAMMSSWASRRQSIPNQESLLSLLWRRVWIVAFLVFVFCVVVSFSLTQMSIVSGDEYANLLQARIFSKAMQTGDLHGRWPAQIANLMVPVELSNRILVDAAGRVITSYQPVFSLMAAPFEALGIRFLFSPLLAAGVVWMSGSCVWRLTRLEWMAGLAVLLMAASASVIGFGMSFFNSNLVLLLNLCFLWALIAGLETRRSCGERFHSVSHKILYGLAAGVSGGLALHTGNQMPHSLAAMPVILWLVYFRQWAFLSGMAAGYLPLIGVFSVGWTQLTHEISLAHRDVSEQSRLALGLQGRSFIGAEISWLIANLKAPNFRQFLQDIMSILRACLWAVPGLAGMFLIAPATSVHAGWKVSGEMAKSLVSTLMLSVILATLFYFFFPLNQGHGWGYRYFQPVLGFFLIASLLRFGPDAADSRPVRWLIFSSLFSLAVMIPLRTSQISGFVSDRMALLPCARDGEQVIPAQICFIDTSAIYWGPDLVQNAPYVTIGQPVDHSRFGDALLLRSSGNEIDAALVRNLWPHARQLVGLDVPGSGSVWLLP
jgi:hypothetical protein